jgi:malate synthase
MEKHRYSGKSKKRKFDRMDRTRDAILKQKKKQKSAEPKAVIEETWNPVPSSVSEGRKYFQQLVHPLPIQTLIEHWEDQQPLLIRRKKIKEEFNHGDGTPYLDKREFFEFI